MDPAGSVYICNNNHQRKRDDEFEKKHGSKLEGDRGRDDVNTVHLNEIKINQ